MEDDKVINLDTVENESFGEEIVIPFDPNKIHIRQRMFTLGQLIDKIDCNEIVFDTKFQRKDDLWDDQKQSRLVESILLAIPIPAFYFDESDIDNSDLPTEERRWQVIDGLQRCSTFRNFCVKKSLVLNGLEYLTQYNGFFYDQLPKTLRRRIEQTQITLYILEKGTPENVKFNIFKRLNTGGLVLTPQEIRHAMNQGKPAKLIAQMANSAIFKSATCNKIPTDRMQDRDFVTRFVAFYLQRYQDYQSDLDSFMAEGMARIRKLTEKECNDMVSDFDKAMHAAYDIFGEDSFRKREYPSDPRKQINKALFETLSVAFAQLPQFKIDKLIERKDTFIAKFMELNRNLYFKQALSQSTGKPTAVKYRHEGVDRIIKETLN